MRLVVIDTNVVIKGLFVMGSKHERILRLFRDNQLNLNYSMELVDELLKVVEYPKIRKCFQIDMEAVELYVKLVERWGVVVVSEKTHLCRDVKDNMVLGTAMAGAKFETTYLITEDEDILALKGRVQGVEIVTPGEFVAW